MRFDWGPLALVLLIAGAASDAACQDTLHVAADGPALWGPELTLHLEVRIGSIEGRSEETFGRVAGVAIGPSGEIAVADGQVPVIRVFDVAGQYLRDLGGKGQGPGEYRQILAIRPTPSGGVAIWDPGNTRVTVFSIDGAKSRSIRMGSAFFTGDPFQVDTAGRFYVKAPRPGSVRRPGTPSPLVWVQADSTGAVLDSIRIPLPSTAPGFVHYTSEGPRKAFSLEMASALSPHGYQVTGRTDVYALYRPMADGRVLRISRERGPVVRVSDGERANWAAILECVGALPMAAGTDLGAVPPRKPVFRTLWVDDEGRIWVSRYARAEHVPVSREEDEKRTCPRPEWREPPIWDVIDPRGRYLGTIETPRGAALAAARGSHVWFVEQGEFGENYVSRYRIGTPNEGPEGG